MDPQIRRMLADLGSQRRDLVSAPAADSKGRDCRDDPRDQATVRAAVEARRARLIERDLHDHGEQASRILAWNRQETFEQDETSGQLPDRFSGQGHRAEMSRKLRTVNPLEVGDTLDKDEIKDHETSEERRTWLQSRNASGFVSVAATPRSSSGGHHFRNGRRVAPLPQNRDGATDPRLYGTVRFGPGGVRVEHAMVNGGKAPVVTKSSDSRPTTAAAVRPTPAPSISSTAAKAPVHDSMRAQVYHNLALWYAARPGQECDQYHERYPDRLQYLGPARDQLIRETTALASRNSEEEIAQYLEIHGERQWMVDAAAKAKQQVEEDDEVAIEAYCKEHTRQKAFLRVARIAFKPKEVVSVAPTATVEGLRQPASVLTPTKTGPVEPKILYPMAVHGSPIAESRSPSISSRGAHSQSSDMGSDNESASSAAPPSSMGTLITTFFNAAGAFLGVHNATIPAPVHASLSVTSRDSAFNPRDFINAIDTLAKTMSERSGVVVPVQRMEGARLEEDGLWEEEEL